MKHKKTLSSFKKGFTLIELLVVITIIGILANIGLNAFTSTQKKSRDTKRKAHLKQIADALEAYYNDKGEYPDDNSDSGNIYGCGTDAENLCTWDSSKFSNTSTTPETIYMIKIPGDSSTGYTYHYDATADSLTNNKFQIYARLENINDQDITKVSEIPQAFTDINCGTKVCNYGVASSNISVNTGRTVADDPDL